MKKSKIQFFLSSLLFVLQLILVAPVVAQEYRFEKITKEHGLSQSTGSCIIQDRKGFMWFGTQDGLNRYDGYSCKVYKHNKNDANSISGNNIVAIVEAADGMLWIATANSGINRFNPETQVFTRYKHNPEDEQSLMTDKIVDLAIDTNQNILIGTRQGLSVLSPNTGAIKHYKVAVDENSKADKNLVYDILVTRQGEVWLGTIGGVCKFNPDKQTYTTYTLMIDEEGNSKSLAVGVSNLFEDSNGSIWMATLGGAYQFNQKTNLLQHYAHNGNDTNSLSNNRVRSILEDALGNIWFATEDGLDVLNYKTSKFKSYTHDKLDAYSLSSSFLVSLYQDKTGVIWIGSLESGINKFNPSSNKFKNFKLSKALETAVSSDLIWGITKDSFGNLWMGSNEGLVVYSTITGKTKRFKSFGTSSKGVLDNFVFSVYIDSKENLWIGSSAGPSLLTKEQLPTIWEQDPTFVHIGVTDKEWSLVDNASCFYNDPTENVIWIGTLTKGIFKIEMDKLDAISEFTNYTSVLEDTTTLSSNWVNTIKKDSKGRMWIATDNGLNLWNPETQKFQKKYFVASEDRETTETNVHALYIDAAHKLWIGNGEGLFCFNPDTEEYESYNVESGLPNNNVYGILEDQQNNLWLSTNQGISKFSKEKKEFRNYDVNDGLQGNEFNWNSYFKDSDEQFYFGGVAGMTSFNLESLKDDTSQPQVAITELKVFNTPIEVNTTNKSLGISEDHDIILKKEISSADTLLLSYHHRVFSLEFSALHFQSSKKNKYKYMLKGFDSDWVETNSDDRKATYTNLDPGSYVFHVKAANSDGVWNEQAKTITIIIEPPFWLTQWFFSLGIFVIIVLVTVVFRVRLRQQLLVRKNEENKIMLKEVHHRVKNNLQVINSLLKLQSKRIKDENVTAVFKEAQDRVLSIASLHEKMYQSENLQYIDVKEHISLLVQDLIKSYAVDKKIDLVLTIENIEIGSRTLVPLGLIINEIITNALKHAFANQEKGTVTVTITKVKEGYFEMLIGDNGVGLKQEFGRSNGLGTKLIQTFVKQLEGKIQQLEQPGTVFKITFKRID